MRRTILSFAAAFLFPIALFAQQASAPSGQTQGPKTEQKQAVQSVDQENTAPDGTRHTVHFAKESAEWSDELHGFLILLRAKEEDPAFYPLASPSDLINLPVKAVKGKDQFSQVDLYTDLRVLEVLGTPGDDQILSVSGKLAFLMKFNPLANEQHMSPIGGSPGTRLDLSPLFSKGQQLFYLGRYWQPTSGKDAILVVTKLAIETLNLKVTVAKPTGQEPKKNAH